MCMEASDETSYMARLGPMHLVPVRAHSAERDVSCSRCGSAEHGVNSCPWPLIPRGAMRILAATLLLLCGSAAAAPDCYPGPGDPVRIGSTYSAPTKQTVRWVAWWCRTSDKSWPAPGWR